MPRRRGRADLERDLADHPRLRREHFDRSVDFASNDRGAILSFLIGARQRLGWAEPGGFLGRQFCYNQRVAPENKVAARIRAAGAAACPAGNIQPPLAGSRNPRGPGCWRTTAKKLLPAERAILCHVASSQPKKEWPLAHWAALHQMAAAGDRNWFSPPRVGEREAALMTELKRLAPDAPVLPPIAGAAAVSRGAAAREGFYFRRHRPAAFRRRAGRADDFAVRPKLSRAMGAGGRAAPVSDRQRLHLRQCRRLRKHEALSRRHHAGAGVRGNHKTGSLARAAGRSDNFRF